jgi:hypothetical protein
MFTDNDDRLVEPPNGLAQTCCDNTNRDVGVDASGVSSVAGKR